MAVSLCVLKEELLGFRTEEYIKEGFNPSFTMCLTLPESGRLLPRCVYVGGLSSALNADRDEEQTVIICLRDRVFDRDEEQASRSNLIIVNENISLNALVSTIQNRFFAVMEWEQCLHDALLRGAGMQELVELCHPFLENHIQITDASFMKLAQSTALDCDDPICVALKKYGYHPEETVAKFRSNRLFDVWAKMNDIYCDMDTSVAKYPTVHKIFKFHGIYYAHVVMTCCVKLPNQAMMDRFRIFTEALSYCVERDWENKFSCIHPYDSVLQDLIEGSIKDITQIEKRASYAGMPMSGNFRIIRIVKQENQNISLGAMMKDFSERFPRCKFINYKDSITAFVISSPHSSDCSGEPMEGLEEYLDRHGSNCGVSSVFRRLTDASHHFRQANLALKYGKELRRGAVWRDKTMAESRVHYFDSCFHLCFLGGEDALDSLWQHSAFYGKLKQLYDNDLQKGSNDLNLLVTYLRLERRITVTAEVLNMHRNSLIYRINRIEEFLGVDLDDESNRLQLMFSSMAAAFYGFGAKLERD